MSPPTRRGRFRRAGALAAVSSLAGSLLAPVTVVAAGAAAVTAVSAVVATQPARASLSGSVLILSTSVNGGSNSMEAQQASALGLSVTVATPSTWDGMSTAQFKGYNAIIIGDPSATSCASSVPSDALSTAGTWGPAVTGNVAVLGTAPALGGANTLVKDAIAYAASGGSGKTGLYVSLDCEYSTASAGTSVPLLASVQGGGFTVTGQGSHCPSDAGSVNTWQALALSQFNGLTSASLGPWPSPACSVEESFNAWPGGLGGLGYYTGASPATFTASDGAAGQAYILAGAPASGATAALAPSTGGQVPAGSAAGGGGNPAAPGVSQADAGGVNTENGDFSQSAADLSVPAFGPGLGFTRTYDAQAAQAQARAGTPGAMGYGWSDNWATSLSPSAKPVAGDVYAISGLGTDNGNGGPPTGVPLNAPGPVWFHSNVYLADTANNRVLEVAGSTGTQWGIAMTQGDIYQIAGSPLGDAGSSASGTPMTKALLTSPAGLVLDSAGNLYIADSGNDRIVEIPVSSGSQWGQSMTADDIYTMAGHRGSPGHSGDGGPATSAFLNTPIGLAFDTSGDLYIADTGNNRVQEVFTSGGQRWGQSMTANDIYTVAGSSSGNSGDTSANGTPATQALLNGPFGVSFNSGGDLFAADTYNNRVVEVPKSGGTEWGISMSANDLYTVAGSATGGSGSSGDGGKATSAKLNGPEQIGLDNGKQLYIADTGNNKIREVAWTSHAEWNVSMTANDIYTIAGTGTAGFSGDGGAALSAKLNGPEGFALNGTAKLYIADTSNNRLRAVSGTTYVISEFAGNGGSLLSVGDNGPALGAAYQGPAAVATDAAGNVYVADEYNNRVQEIAAAGHVQFGITMTAGDVYTVAGNANGKSGTSGNGGKATSALLNSPLAVAVDGSGNLFIADSGNNRIQKVAAGTGIVSTVAGSASGTAGASGDGGAATSALLDDPNGIAVDGSGNVYVADFWNERVQEVPAGGGTQWGQAMTGGDMYTVAGDPNGVNYGTSGDGGPVKSALLNLPAAVAVDPAGDVYIADSANNRIQEMYHGGQSWGRAMTAGDMYTVAGSASGAAGLSGDGGPATRGLLDNPVGVTISVAGDLYIADTYNNRVQEVAAGRGVQWAQQMAPGDIYTVAGSATGAWGDAGLGGPATAALMNAPESLAVDPSGNLYLPDSTNNLIDEVVSATVTGNLFPLSPAPGTSGTPGGVAISQPGGAQVTFYPVGSGCFAPYVLVPSGQYCALPQDVGANLSLGGGTYTFTPKPGTTYTYNSGGQLTAIADAAGDTLTVQYGTPLPGSGNCPSAASWCQLITAASGRTLTIGYNNASPVNQVTSVTDPMGRQWTYAYSGNDLASATDPMGNKTSYGYGAGTTGPLNANDLTTITGPNAQPGGPDAGKATTVAYNAAGQVTSQTDPMGFTTTYTWTGFNPATGNGVITVADPDGNTTVYYYVQGTLAAQSAWTGTTLTSEQDNAPDQAITTGDNSAGTQLDTAAADANGNITTTSYDTTGNPVAVTAPDGVGSQVATTTQQSTSLNQPNCASAVVASSTCSASPGPSPVTHGQAITPPSSAPPQGVTWTLYDDYGNQLYDTTGVYEPGSNTASYTQTTYQLFKNNTITLNGTNISCAATPPSPSLPCATINADGVVTQLAYNSAGDLTSSSTPDGNPGNELATTTYGYDGDGEQTSATSPDGNLSGANPGNYTTITAFSSDGQQTSITQGDGTGHTVTPRATAYAYDANGNQVSVHDARGYTTTTTYNADDQATLVTDPDGNATLTCYDGAGNVTQTVPPVGVAANNLTASSCPAAYPADYGNRLASDATTYTFDANGNQTAMTSPAPAGQSGPQTTTYAYDANGDLVTVTAPPASNGGASQVTVSTYNSAGELATQTTGSGTSAASTLSYCYDPNGDQTSVVYPDGNTSGTAPCETASPWIVDPNSHPTQAAYQTTSAYDSAGELVSATSPATAAAPNGATTTLTYDQAGNELTAIDPNGVTTTWTYNPLSRPATISYSGSSAHSVGFGYDANGYKTSMTDAAGASSYVYDPFGELTSGTNGAGQVTGYGYNADGQVSSITYPLPSGATWATSHTVNYTYDNADVQVSATDFNGNQLSIASTADHLPSSLTLGSTGDLISTTYDNADMPSLITLKNSSSTLASFAYTDAPAGTILNEADTPTSPQSPAVYTYDTRGRVTSMTPGSGSTLTYGFDASSNLTTLPGGATGTYDHAGELTSSAVSGTTTTYSYNADGQQLSAVQGSTTTASGSWNGAGRLTAYSDAAASMSAATYDGTGLRSAATTDSVTQNFVWNTVPVVPQLLMDSANAYIYAAGGTPAEQVNLATGTIRYLVADRIGSVRGIVSSSGNLTATTNYDAWGNPETSGGLSAYSPIGYAGGYTDPVGLIYLINRYYNPQSGQFISLDPAVGQTQEPYAYASGNPVSGTDPTGLCTYTTGRVRCRTDKLLWGFKNYSGSGTSLKTFLRYRAPVCGAGLTFCNNHGNSHGKFLDWSSDGCSYSPQNPDGFPFWKACLRHDFGHRNYRDQGRCNTGAFKKAVNNQFYNDLQHGICDKQSAWVRWLCRRDALAYKAAVDNRFSC